MKVKEYIRRFYDRIKAHDPDVQADMIAALKLEVNAELVDYQMTELRHGKEPDGKVINSIIAKYYRKEDTITDAINAQEGLKLIARGWFKKNVELGNLAEQQKAKADARARAKERQRMIDEVASWE